MPLFMITVKTLFLLIMLYHIQVFLKNGDVLEFREVTEKLEFSSTNSGGIYRINDTSFFLHGFLGLINSGISSKYLSLAIPQEKTKKYKNIPESQFQKY